MRIRICISKTSSFQAFKLVVRLSACSILCKKPGIFYFGSLQPSVVRGQPTTATANAEKKTAARVSSRGFCSTWQRSMFGHCTEFVRCEWLLLALCDSLDFLGALHNYFSHFGSAGREGLAPDPTKVDYHSVRLFAVAFLCTHANEDSVFFFMFSISSNFAKLFYSLKEFSLMCTFDLSTSVLYFSCCLLVVILSVFVSFS